MRKVTYLTGLVAGVMLSAGVGNAAPTLLKQVDQHGDFIAIGNTLGWDCYLGASGVSSMVVVGTVSGCPNNNISDTSPDMYWVSSDTTAIANNTNTPDNAGSTAQLNLPDGVPGSNVNHAYLIWSSSAPQNTSQTKTATLGLPGGGSSQVTTTNVVTGVPLGSGNNNASRITYFYQAVADVTGLVQANGTGPYRVSGIVSDPSFVGADRNFLYAAWSLIVFYEDYTEPLRNLTLFTGLDAIGSNTSITIPLSGFFVPHAGFDAKLGVIAYDGDERSEGDWFSFARTSTDVEQESFRLSGADNPATNFFNSSRTMFGVRVGTPGDLPQLTGAPGSMAGYDLDIVDVTTRLSGGDSAAFIRVGTTSDTFLLGAFITSISTYKPDFTSSTKSVTIWDTEGNVVPSGDPVHPDYTIRYTIEVTNVGNDTAEDVTFEDPLDSHVEYIPGTITIGDVAMTDGDGDDDAWYDDVNATVHADLHTIAVGDDPIVIEFDVKILGTGTIRNVATIVGDGTTGSQPAHVEEETRGNGVNPDDREGTIVVVNECTSSGDCPVEKPNCSQGKPWEARECFNCMDDEDIGLRCARDTPICDVETGICKPCETDEDCGLPGTTPAPYCTPSGACGQCLSDEQCGFPYAICDTADWTCRPCLVDPDCPESVPACLIAEEPDSGNVCVECWQDHTDFCKDGRDNFTPVCNYDTHECIGCGPDVECERETAPICLEDTGECVQCTEDNPDLCVDPTPYCLWPEAVCVECLDDTHCADPGKPYCKTGGTCVECLGSSHCEDPDKPVCLVSKGECVQCVTDDSGNCKPCNVDSQCGDTSSGVVCTVNDPDSEPDSGYCVEGCRGEHGNGCPEELVCTTVDEQIGDCVQCTDADKTRCTGETPACDTDEGVCIPCRTNDDCTDPAAPVCTSSGMCDECEHDSNGNCTCKVDSDCGGLNNGKVCEAEICVSGCRGVTGSGCPSDLECTSTTEELGECKDSTGTGGTGGEGGSATDRHRTLEGGGFSCAVPATVPESAGFGLLTVLFGLFGLRRCRRSDSRSGS